MTAGIFFFLRDAFAVVNIILLCRYFLGLDIRTGRARGIITASLFLLNSAVYTYGRFTPDVRETTDIITDIASYALYLFVFFVFFKCTQKSKTVLFLTCYIFVMDMIYGIAAPYVGENDDVKIYFTAGMFLIVDIILILAVKFRHVPKFPDIISVTPKWIFVSIMIFCLACYYRQFGISSSIYEVIYIAATILMLISVGFFIFNMIKATQEIASLYSRMNEISDYYMRLAKNDEELRAFRHDYKNHMNVVSILIDNGNMQEASKYIQELSLSAGKCFKKYSTGNDILDMIMANKSKSAENFGYTLTFKGFFPQTGIEPADVCTVCANLIDNAIEHGSLKEGENNIFVESNLSDSSVIFTVTNRVSGAAAEDMSTSKSDKVNHGFGMKNVKKTVKKYDGMINIQSSDCRFSIDVLMKIPENAGK